MGGEHGRVCWGGGFDGDGDSEHGGVWAGEICVCGALRLVFVSARCQFGASDGVGVLSRIYAAASVPDELVEASRMDEAGEWLTYTIALRLMVLALVAIWNNYFLPLVMLSSDTLYPITVGLQLWNANSSGTHLFLSNLVVCGSLVSAIPLLIGCVFLQRYWRGGLGAGSVKG